MSHRIRGYRPPVLPTGPKPQQTPGDKARVALRPGGAVLGPGQHLVLPGRTGLAHLQDHFDARQRPDYDARLKGEAPRPDNAKADAQQLAQAASAFDPAQHAAESLLRRMPAVDGDQREEDEDSPEQRESESASDEPEVFARRSVELHGGIFTLAEGSLDAEQHALGTLEAFLDGDVPFISVAVDLGAIPYGTPIAIPSLDAVWGRTLVFRAVQETARTAGALFGYLEICVSASDDLSTLRAIDRVLAVTFG